MSHPKTIAEFAFITNKSFLGRGNPITIPSRICQVLKENGLVDSTPAIISFADSVPVAGSINIGWRAGGKYYQIRMKAPENHNISHLKFGATLRVRLLKQAEDWLVELHL